MPYRIWKLVYVLRKWGRAEQLEKEKYFNKKDLKELNELDDYVYGYGFRNYLINKLFNK